MILNLFQLSNNYSIIPTESKEIIFYYKVEDAFLAHPSTIQVNAYDFYDIFNQLNSCVYTFDPYTIDFNNQKIKFPYGEASDLSLKFFTVDYSNGGETESPNIVEGQMKVKIYYKSTVLLQEDTFTAFTPVINNNNKTYTVNSDEKIVFTVSLGTCLPDLTKFYIVPDIALMMAQ